MFSGWHYLTSWEQVKWFLLLAGQCLFGLTTLTALGVALKGRGGVSCGGVLMAVVFGLLTLVCWKGGVAIVAEAAFLNQ